MRAVSSKEEVRGAAGLTKQGSRAPCFGCEAKTGAWFQTPADWQGEGGPGGGKNLIKVESRNQEQIWYVSLRCFMCQQLPPGWSACSLIRYMHIHMLSGAKYITLEEQNHYWLICGYFFMTLYGVMTVCIITSGARYHTQPLSKKLHCTVLIVQKNPNNPSNCLSWSKMG